MSKTSNLDFNRLLCWAIPERILHSMTKLRFAIASLLTVICCCLTLTLVLYASPSGSCGESITYTISDNALILDGTGIIDDYTPSSLPWLEEAAQITSIVIPDGITMIGVNAFLNLSANEVTIPESVTLISPNSLGYTYRDESYTPIEGFKIIGKAGSAAEDYATENGFTFEALTPPVPTGSCGANAVWTLSADGTLTISGSGAISDFSNSSSTPWADYISGKDDFRITSLVIETGITSIGSNAFADCRRLSSVSLPDSLTAIGSSAFSGCSGLSEVSIPGSVKTIGKRAFSSCTTLSSVVFGSGITAIDNEAFSLSAIRELSLPASLSQIGDKAFYGCTSLTAANLSGVTKLATKAFEGCTSLTTVNATALISIGKSAFEGCTVLKSFTFPNTLTTVGSRAFYSCTSLTSVQIPNSVTRIGEYAFSEAGLSSITLGSVLTKIEEGVFENCRSLSSVTLGDHVSEIQERAFAGCSSLTTILLPRSVRSIADNALGYRYNDDSGTYEKISGHTLNISAYLPSTGKLYADKNGFGFTSLGVIDVDGGDVSSSITWSINTETGVLMINGKGAMPDYPVFSDTPWNLYSSYLKTVVIGKGITEIGSCSFENCTGLTSLTLSATVVDIGDYAFAGTSISRLSLPAKLLTIGESAFEGCSSLVSVTFPEGLSEIGQAAFRAPNGLTTVYIPESVTSIGANAIGVTAGNAPIFNFVIKGTAGSIAENYAQHHGITFREDGFVTVTDKNSGASITIRGEDSPYYKLILEKISNSLSPAVLLAGSEYALLYDVQLFEGDEALMPEGSISLRLPIPEGVNSLTAKIFSYDDTGTFSEIEMSVENGFFIFQSTGLGKLVITNADLNSLITITVYHQFADGSEASPTEVILATLGANYRVKPVTMEAYKANHNTLSGCVEGSFSLTFTYYPVQDTEAEDTETDPSVNPTPSAPKPTNTRRTWLIVLEVILVLALLAAVAALIILNKKKMKEVSEKDSIVADAAQKGVVSDKFADTLVVPEAPTQEIDIQSLFADEPEEDTAAIEALLRKAKNNKSTKN